MSEMIHFFMEICYAIFGGFCLQYFLGSFLEHRNFMEYRNFLERRKFLEHREITGDKKFSGLKPRETALFAAASYAACTLLLSRFLPYGYADIRVLARQAALLGATALLAAIFYKAGRAVTGYLVITFAAVGSISFFIAYSVLLVSGGLYDVWMWCMERNFLVNGGNAPIFIRATAIGQQILMFIVYSVLYFLSLRKIVNSFREKEYPASRTELSFLLAPSLAGLLVCVLLRMLVVTVEEVRPELLYDRHPALVVIIPVILILCLLSILYSIKLFQDMVALNRERNSRAVLERQIGGIQAQMAEMEHIHSGIRSMKHDMKNTLAVIMRLARQGGENAELQEYLSQLNHNFDRLELRYRTGNGVVDTLLNMKSHELEKSVPEVKLCADELLFTENIVIGSYDIGVIVGNALDNAAEACEKIQGEDRERFIRLSSFSRGKMFFIKVENSFDGKLAWKKGMEFPASTKPDKKAHGIGLANIQSTAEKYHGGVDWQVKSGKFVLTVMLKNERKNLS